MLRLHEDTTMNYVYTFDRLSEFVSAVDVPKPHNPASDTAWANDSDFCGATRAGAFDMARMGWPEGRKNMVAAMAQARPSIALTPAFVMDVAGAYPIAALAAAGDPCSMVLPDPVETAPRPIVRLAVNVWASCAYTSAQFTAYGAAVLSYIDAIEASGARVELNMLCHCTVDSTRDSYTAMVPIKRAEEPVEIDRLTYCFTHVSMLRRLFFTHMQIAEGVAGKMPGCGYPRNPDEGDVEKGVIVVPGINTIHYNDKALKSPAACAAYLSNIMEKVLNQVGVELPELAFGGGSK
jgi:hypothetical protein